MSTTGMQEYVNKLQNRVDELELLVEQLKHERDSWESIAHEWQVKYESIESDTELIMEYDKKYKSQCIYIGQLQTTIDVLVDKLSKVREIEYE